jgi:hypothetical protein
MVGQVVSGSTDRHGRNWAKRLQDELHARPPARDNVLPEDPAPEDPGPIRLDGDNIIKPWRYR